MTYILSYSSLSKVFKQSDSQFGGSSRYKLIGGELLEKTNQISKPNIQEQIKTEKPISKDAKCSEVEIVFSPGNEVKKIYKLNKSKVRKRCHALSRLEKSKKFLAFYTITFPEGLTDIDCYKLFNLWLTRCRKTSGLNTYLWVAERQKNGTIHFHLLTNDFMKIGIVNLYMAKALTNKKKNGHNLLASVDTEKYNGIDVKKVGRKKKTIIGYLTKYITKNNIEFYRLPWHCSHDVSRLFTALHFEKEDSKKYSQKLPQDKGKYSIHESDFCKVAAFKFIPDDELFRDLDDINELVYSSERLPNGNK
jgi:hypothetical protein